MKQLEVGKEIEGELVDEREICTLLGDKAGIKRSRDQVISTVSHRIDCSSLFLSCGVHGSNASG
jgi:hypothetical protein